MTTDGGFLAERYESRVFVVTVLPDFILAVDSRAGAPAFEDRSLAAAILTALAYDAGIDGRPSVIF